MKKKILILLILISCIFLYVYQGSGDQKYIELLPETATEISETSYQDVFLPDSYYELKAKVSYNEFKSYITKLDLVKVKDSDGFDVFILKNQTIKTSPVRAMYIEGFLYLERASK